MDGPLLHLVLRTSKNVQGGTTMSAQDIIKSIEDAQLREVAEFKTGDTVRVHAKVKEGNRERIQVFEGTVIKRQKKETGNYSATDKPAAPYFQAIASRQNCYELNSLKRKLAMRNRPVSLKNWPQNCSCGIK